LKHFYTLLFFFKLKKFVFDDFDELVTPNQFSEKTVFDEVDEAEVRKMLENNAKTPWNS
jgi:hypothetical protein